MALEILDRRLLYDVPIYAHFVGCTCGYAQSYLTSPISGRSESQTISSGMSGWRPRPNGYWTALGSKNLTKSRLGRNLDCPGPAVTCTPRSAPLPEIADDMYADVYGSLYALCKRSSETVLAIVGDNGQLQPTWTSRQPASRPN